ncbi:hypothetical protein ACHAXR_005996 [Thalassiosira sp. AJA248-18]
MSTKLLVLSPSKQGRSRRRSSEGFQQESHVNQSLNSFNTSDGRDGLHSFLHRELRISSEVAGFYCTSLIENGYDDVASLQDATEHDLKELGVKIGHARRIKRAVFSNCMRNNERPTSGTRRVSELHLFSNEVTDESIVSRKSIEGSLLSDYARQEMTNYTPSSREQRSVDMDLATAKELLIRKQAEKIASLEAKLANAGINTSLSSDHDELLSHISRSSRGGSADTYSKKLTPEERLEQHRQRKMQENKYKEKSGVWEQAPHKKKEKNLTKKVSENDELVHKLTSDPTHRKKIDEDEKRAKRLSRNSLGDDAVKMSPSSSAIERSRADDSGYRHDRHPSSRRSSRGDGNSSFHGNRQHRASRVSCETCGSTQDCEPDVDNPGVFYCKSCWEEYEGVDEEAIGAPEVQIQVSHNQVPHSQVASIEEDPTHHALWVVHDNPQLGDKIICSGPRSMECMLETKEPGKKNCVRIIVGDIDFSGKAKLAGIGNADGLETEIGTECIRIRNVKGYYVDHNQAASRLSRDKSIYEFHLGDENAHLLTGRAATKSVGEFFKGCDGAIDVILDPQKDFGGWYPQKEARSGGRKIAPQFRSKGVGYIRLGDDMSENGLAFLSSNACLNFLSSVGSSKKAPPSSKPLPPTGKPSFKKREGSDKSFPAAPRGKTNSFRRQQPPQKDESDDYSSDDESVEEVQKVSEVLKQLQSPDMQANMKWKDKAELLSHLGKGASREDGRHSRSGALNIIQDTLGAKNVNVHVIRSSLIAAGMIGVAMGGELVTQNSWKTIMIETLKLLKSKQCGSVAKTVLAQLHGRCFTLSNSMECIAHVLGVGLAASARKGRKSMMESPKPRKTSANGGNSIEVIEWLAETTERERSMEVIDPMLDRNGLSMLINLFFSHVDHRDQRCRKNVLDGLMHCALYGVQRLEMDSTRVMRMCSGLKEANPKGWNQIFQNVKIILEEEQR